MSRQRLSEAFCRFFGVLGGQISRDNEGRRQFII